MQGSLYIGEKHARRIANRINREEGLRGLSRVTPFMVIGVTHDNAIHWGPIVDRTFGEGVTNRIRDAAGLDRIFWD